MATSSPGRTRVASNDAPILERMSLDEYAETLKARCIREHGWQPELTKRVFAAYRQFLELKQRLEDWDAKTLSPSSLVDKMWHSHLLDNRHYREYCISACGHEIFHDPEGGLDVEARTTRIRTTQVALKSRYDYQNIDNEIWEFPLPFERRVRQRTDSESKGMKILVSRSQGATPRIYTFQFSRISKFAALYKMIAREFNIQPSSFRLLLDGQRIEPNNTPRLMEMDEGEVIDFMLE
jgi:hypothetical protein